MDIQTFSRLREEDAYYVDQTRLVWSLVQRGRSEFSADARNVVGFKVKTA